MFTKTIVVKLGGSTLGGDSGHASPSTILSNLMRLLAEGAHLVIVHGGGKAINQLLTKMGQTPQFKNGLRVTDAATLEAALMVMRGQINPALVDEFNRASQQQEWSSKPPKAIGLTGIDGNLIQAKRETTNGDIGLVGQITQVNLDPVVMALEWGYVPIIAPFGVATEPQPEGSYIFNINADNVAAHLAAALEADFCVFLTDVAGILDDHKQTIVRLDPAQARMLEKNGIISGGMIPKVESAITALNGAKFVAIVDGNEPDALYKAVQNFDIAGTLLVNRDELEYSFKVFESAKRDKSSSFPYNLYNIEAAPLDSQKLGAFLQAAFLNTPDFGYDSSHHGDFAGLVSVLQAGKYGPYQAEASLVVRKDSQIIGATLVTMPERDNWQGVALLAEVAVHPDYRGKGIAHELVRRSLEVLKQAGAVAVRLNVTRGNDAAYYLYRNLGFKPIQSET